MIGGALLMGVVLIRRSDGSALEPSSPWSPCLSFFFFLSSPLSLSGPRIDAMSIVKVGLPQFVEPISQPFTDESVVKPPVPVTATLPRKSWLVMSVPVAFVWRP